MSGGNYVCRKWFLHIGSHPQQLHGIDATVQCHPSFHEAFYIIETINIVFCKWLSNGLEGGSISIPLSILRCQFEQNHADPVHTATLSVISLLYCFRSPVFYVGYSQSPLARIILLPTLPQYFLSPEARGFMETFQLWMCVFVCFCVCLHVSIMKMLINLWIIGIYMCAGKYKCERWML